MKIGYDAKRAAANFTGLGNYSRYVIEGVAGNDPQSDIRLYVPRLSHHPEYRVLLDHSNVTEHLPDGFLSRQFKSFWRSFSITGQIKRDKLNLYHGLSNELPFGIRRTGVRSIVTIHDLIFLRLPYCYKLIDRLIYNIKFKYACRKANQVIAVSECTKRDIIHFYGIDPNKISVIYQGCNKMFKETISEEQKHEVRTLYHLPERYILNVGTLEKRKNLFLIVKALKNMPEEIHLVAVGRRTNYSDMVMKYAVANGIANRIHLLHKVAFRHLPAVYRNSELFAYPSFYEGFGIPIIEAISCGLPVIAAKGSCLEEAGGNGAIYINPDSPEQFADAANRLINDKNLQKELVTAGKKHIERFDDNKLAQQMIEFYQKF